MHLAHQGRRHRPVIVQFNAKRDAATIGFRIIIIFFDKVLIVGDNAGAGIGPAAAHIVDIAAIATIPAHRTHRDRVAQRGVDKAFKRPTDAAMRHGVQLTAHLAIKALGIRLVGDDLDRTRHGACAIERALRPSERLNTGDVIDMDVERALNGRDRLFIQIHANGRL